MGDKTKTKNLFYRFLLPTFFVLSTQNESKDTRNEHHITVPVPVLVHSSASLTLAQSEADKTAERSKTETGIEKASTKIDQHKPTIATLWQVRQSKPRPMP